MVALEKNNETVYKPEVIEACNITKGPFDINNKIVAEYIAAGETHLV